MIINENNVILILLMTIILMKCNYYDNINEEYNDNDENDYNDIND